MELLMPCVCLNITVCWWHCLKLQFWEHCHGWTQQLNRYKFSHRCFESEFISLWSSTCYRLDSPGGPPSLLYGVYQVIAGAKAASIDYPPHCSADLKERAEICLYSPLCAFMAGHRVNFTFTFSAFRIRCLHLNTCRVYSLIPVCTLFIISLPFVLNHSKLEGTVRAVTLIRIYVLSRQTFDTCRLQLQTAQLRSLVQVYVNITDFIRNITHTYKLLIFWGE
jgi:hypothetical protein